MIDFDIPEDLAALRDEIRGFVIDAIVPYERDPRLTRHGPDEELRTELVGLARKAGLLTFQAPRRFGGRAPSHREVVWQSVQSVGKLLVWWFGFVVPS